MANSNYFISCDWGTSNFRLSLTRRDTLEVLKEVKTDRGIKRLYQEFTKQNLVDQQSFFSIYLVEQLAHIVPSDDKIIVVGSGMLSSSIGLMELPYASLPFDSSGKSLKKKVINLNERISLLLTSGVKSENDVMRGEETQALGLAEMMPIKEKGVLILPGTHSKHILFDKGYFLDFNTYMTGELFDAISSQTILNTSVKKTKWDGVFKPIYLQGVKDGANTGLVSLLFKIRAKELLDKMSKEESYYYLSRLLIGSELAYLKDKKLRIAIAAEGILFELYRTAIEFLVSQEVMYISGKELVKALLLGQRKILDLPLRV